MSTVPCEKHEIINCRTCKDQAAEQLGRRVDHAMVRQGHRVSLSQPEPETTRAFRARHDGHCMECDLPIYAGRQMIVGKIYHAGTPGETKIYIHEDCA